MYLLLILLISPAFGRPSSDQLDVGADIVSQLQSFINFIKETGVILDNSNLTEKVVLSLLEAEQNHLEVKLNLEALQYKVPELQIVGNYFQDYMYNQAESYLRETSQELRKLAHRAVLDVRDVKILMKGFDNEPVLLKISLGKMEDLMIETLETLKEADKKFRSAVQTFENLNTSIASKYEQLGKMLANDSAEHKAWVDMVAQTATEACKSKTEKGFFGFLKDIDKEIRKIGIDAGIDDAIEKNCPDHVEDEISKFGAELENLQTITERMLERGDNFVETIKEAIESLTGEIEQINSMTEDAKDVSKNIDNYPTEYLREYQTIQTTFLSGLDDLKTASEKFLAQPNYHIIYRQYLSQRRAEAEKINVAENLLAAERNILEVSALKYEFEQKYLPAYNEAKSYLRKTRQELRELASSTRTDARDLKIVVEHLEESNSSVFFKIFINRMKNKRIDPLEILKEAREKYDSAVKTFENTNSFIATKIRESGRGQNFEKTLKVFIEILTEEIELITVWTKSAKVVSSNIENNSEEILREFKSVRNIFINGLDDLKQATDTFLAQPRDIIKL